MQLTILVREGQARERESLIKPLVIGILVLLLITLPYMWAVTAGIGTDTFGGFLFNPIDGNSYLAKMYQGWQGSWQFTLPYTAEPGEGTYIFLYYISLGQIARLAGLSLPLTFHLARVIGAGVMLLALWRFFATVMVTPRLQLLAFALAAIGSGLGWLASIWGAFTPDLWVAEAYPFLSSFANPHFPLGLALALWLLTPDRLGEKADGPAKRARQGGKGFGWRFLFLFTFAFLLGIVMPFGAVVVILVLGGVAVWEIISQLSVASRQSSVSDQCSSFQKIQRLNSTLSTIVKESQILKKTISVVLGASPVLVYYSWVVSTHSILKGWSDQNLTPSPPIGYLVVAFAPALILALPGAWHTWRQKIPAQRVLLVWIGLGILLIYSPFGLQRRFILGLMIPLAGLAAIGLDVLAGGRKRLEMTLIIMLFILSIPSNLMVLLTAFHGIQTHSPILYLSDDEIKVFEWLTSETPKDALVLASPATSLFVPAYSGRRVIYGHPYETVNAEEREKFVREIYQSRADLKALQPALDIDFVVVGPRELVLGKAEFTRDLRVVFQSGNVTVYSASDQ